MDADRLRANCEQCAALCCITVAFDKSALFAYDKPACEACRHLDDANRCRIHDERERRGFRGCVSFDCHGAGQRVTQELFDGRSWRDDPSLLGPMAEAFTAIRQVHELILLLTAAADAPITEVEQTALATLRQELAPAEDSADAAVTIARDGALLRKARDFLRSLRDSMQAAS